MYHKITKIIKLVVLLNKILTFSHGRYHPITGRSKGLRLQHDVSKGENVF